MGTFGAFSARGKWFRGNCHTHTKLSDGSRTALETARSYREKGYDFLVLTDHGKCQEDVSALQTRDFLVINGVELSPAAAVQPANPHHIVAVGVAKQPKPSQVKRWTAASAVRWVKRNGGIAIYGHPYWCGHDINTMREGRDALGVEVFNTVTQTTRGLGDSSVHLDQALTLGFRWTVFAVDDTHVVKRDAFGGWIMVRARALTQSAIMDAIRKKHFYATTGPEIRSLSLRQGIARIACSPVHEIVWHCEGPCGVRIAAGKRLITRAQFDLAKQFDRTKYLRVEIIDAQGRKAWSNPIWRNKKTRRWSD